MNSIPRRYTVFTVMWVLAVFFHMIHRSDIVSGILPALTVLAGGFVLLNPTKVIRLVIFSLIHACVYLIHAPNTGNHEFFAFFVDLTIVVVYGLNYLKSTPQRTNIFGILEPILKSFTVILYFLAFFHKLNWNYLDITSCGGTMLMEVALNNEITAPFFANFSNTTIAIFKYINIYASLILELLIPVFLLFRRFAWIGCLLGILLHGTLGFIYFWHFTPMLYALYALFLPNSFFDNIYERFQYFKKVKRQTKIIIMGFMLLIPILYVLKYYYPLIELELGSFSRNSSADWSLGINIRSFIGWFPFLIYSVIFLYFLLSKPRTTAERSLKKIPIGYYILSLILILNGLSPYFGIKTHQSFSMFSGLLTHEQSNNHLFMPNINIVNTQNDIVTPCQEDHTNYAKQLRWSKDEKLVFYELQKRVTVLKNKGVTGIQLCFSRNGKKVYLQQAEQEASLIIPLSWVDKKFRIYREIPINSKRCYY